MFMLVGTCIRGAHRSWETQRKWGCLGRLPARLGHIIMYIEGRLLALRDLGHDAQPRGLWHSLPIYGDRLDPSGHWVPRHCKCSGLKTQRARARRVKGGSRKHAEHKKTGVHASEDIILPLVVLDSPELGGKGPPGARGRELGGGRGERSGLLMPS